MDACCDQLAMLGERIGGFIVGEMKSVDNMDCLWLLESFKGYDAEVDICGGCTIAFHAIVDEERERIWDQIPRIFGRPKPTNFLTLGYNDW